MIIMFYKFNNLKKITRFTHLDMDKFVKNYSETTNIEDLQ